MAKAINYQQLNQELEEILDSLQSSELDIDEAIKQYERGMTVVVELQSYLKQAENKVTNLKRNFDTK
ncbi:MAG: exodeoxyribonuclease VII small subunit [Candidatus Saccharimonadales bacterium]